ncbi:MAG: hypothetical protein ISR69_10785 [Gammaproteobacteria bacterium]|nr:hypothetical protein [Gammaproteobacteria bacterium]
MFAEYSIYNSVIMLFIVLYSFGLDKIFGAKYYKSNYSKAILNEAFLFNLFNFTIIFIIVIVLYPFSGDFMSRYSLSINLIIVILINALVVSLNSLLFIKYQIKSEGKNYFGFLFIKQATFLLLVIMFINQQSSVIQIFLFDIIANVFISIIYYFQNHKIKVRFHVFKLKINPYYYKIGYPLLISELGIWIMQNSERVIVATYGDLSQVSAITISNNLIQGLRIAINGLIIKIVPDIYNIIKKHNNILKNKLFVKYLAYFNIFLVLTLTTICFLYENIIVLLSNEKYLHTQVIIILFSVAFAFNINFTILSNYLVYKNKTKLIAIILTTSGVFSLLTNLILIKDLGLLTVGIAQVISSLLALILVLFSIKSISKRLI